MKARHTVDCHFYVEECTTVNLLWTLCQGLWLRDVMAWVEDHLADKLAEEGTIELNPKNIYNIFIINLERKR